MGDCEGFLVGFEVGELVGAREGFCVGSDVGEVDGAIDVGDFDLAIPGNIVQF